MAIMASMVKVDNQAVSVICYFPSLLSVLLFSYESSRHLAA